MSKSYVGALAVFVTLMTSGCGAPKSSEEEIELTRGKQAYKVYCALCHGEEGEGYAADHANALNNEEFLASVSDDFLRRAIEEGRPGTPMAAYGVRHRGPLNDETVAALVKWIRHYQSGPNVELDERERKGDLTRAAVTYAEKCASCHGDEGEGKTALSLNNAVFLDSASDAQIAYAIEKGRSNTAMPAFEGQVSSADIDGLVTLIRSWQKEIPKTPLAPASTDDVLIHPDGPMPNFSALREGRYVPSAELAREYAKGARMIILDARPPSDYSRFHIPGAVVASYYDVDKIVPHLPKDGTWIIAYCGCPHAASGRVMDRLRELGFEHTAVIDEGIFHWKDEGHPVHEGPERFPE